MTLEQSLHQRWAADERLTVLLPADRVKTGRAVGTATPYVTLLRQSSRVLLRTNAGDAIEEVVLRINVWHQEHDAGQTLAEAVKLVFDRSGFPLSGGDRVLRMLRHDEEIVQHSDGLWQFRLDFTIQVYLAFGV